MRSLRRSDERTPSTNRTSLSLPFLSSLRTRGSSVVAFHEWRKKQRHWMPDQAGHDRRNNCKGPFPAPAGGAAPRSRPCYFLPSVILAYARIQCRCFLQLSGRQWFWVLLPKQKACPEPVLPVLSGAEGSGAEGNEVNGPCEGTSSCGGETPHKQSPTRLRGGLGRSRRCRIGSMWQAGLHPRFVRRRGRRPGPGPRSSPRCG